MRPTPFTIYVLLLIFSLTVPAPAGHIVDHGLYAELLVKYVHDGRVDYRGFKREEFRLDRYLENLAKVDPPSLSRNERYAFYINAYNAWTIKLILSGYPGILSIKDLGSFLQSPWKKKIVRLGQNTFTLDQIEHDILRPEFRDPRVHFAINCAARSCPPLRAEPYTGSRLNRQLDNSTKSFINDPQSNYIQNNTLYVSKIFKWFKEDFNHDIYGFFLKHAQGNLKKELENKRNMLNVKYLAYDWSLNGE